MKRLLLLLACSVAMFGQDLPTLNSPDYNAAQAKFDPAYWASQPDPVRALQYISDATQRIDTAIVLSRQGYVIDAPIMVTGYSPYAVMWLRVFYGYTWVPSALQQPVCSAPGIQTPYCQQYDPTKPPVGSIKVSLDLRDYPAFDPAFKE